MGGCTISGQPDVGRAAGCEGQGSERGLRRLKWPVCFSRGITGGRPLLSGSIGNHRSFPRINSSLPSTHKSIPTPNRSLPSINNSITIHNGSIPTPHKSIPIPHKSIPTSHSSIPTPNRSIPRKEKSFERTERSFECKEVLTFALGMGMREGQVCKEAGQIQKQVVSFQRRV
jgi:hypothetical protein